MEFLDHPFPKALTAYVPPESLVLEQLQTLIDLTFSNNRNINVYCQRLNLSPYRLNGITGYYLNKTVYELLQERIHREAEHLLKNTRYTVKEIAYLIGCSDVAYFCRDFKRRTGKTPKAFRNEIVGCSLPMES
jgi:AraC-like DNA-binding protein